MHRGRQKGVLLSQLQIWEAGANNKEQLTITRKAFQSADLSDHFFCQDQVSENALASE